MLKLCNNYFSLVLTKLINLSFETGTFTDICKSTKGISILKKEDPLVCNNYRPTSLLPISCKIFEKLDTLECMISLIKIIFCITYNLVLEISTLHHILLLA